MKPQLILLAIASQIFSACDRKVSETEASLPDPVGTWEVRHDVRNDEDGALIGQWTITVKLNEDGTFTELGELEMQDEEQKVDPINYTGHWKQDGEVVRLKRDGESFTDSFVIDSQGIRMEGNVAGQTIFLKRKGISEKSVSPIGSWTFREEIREEGNSTGWRTYILTFKEDNSLDVTVERDLLGVETETETEPKVSTGTWKQDGDIISLEIDEKSRTAFIDPRGVMMKGVANREEFVVTRQLERDEDSDGD